MPSARATEPPRARLAVQLLLALSAGCEPELTELGWGISFAQGTNLSQEAAAVSVWITRENCEGTEKLYGNELDGEGRAPEPGALSPGNYGFAAEAFDAQCRPIAFGCINRKLPAQVAAPIELVLQPRAGEARCGAESCRAGRCVQPLLDAGPDPRVQGALDAARSSDASSDASDEPMAESPSVDASSADASTSDASSGGSADCPGGVRRPSGHCYRASFEPESFLEARKSCVAWNKAATIVIIDNDSEERWVVEAISESHAFWVGVTDDDFEGVWFTERGQLMTHENWDPYSPSGGRSYNCGLYNPSSGAWRDRSCFESNPVVCEAP